MISGLIGITIRKLGHALTLVFCLLGIIVFAAPFSEEPPGDDEKNSSSGSDGDDDYEDHYGSESDNPPGDPEAFKVWKNMKAAEELEHIDTDWQDDDRTFVVKKWKNYNRAKVWWLVEVEATPEFYEESLIPTVKVGSLVWIKRIGEGLVCKDMDKDGVFWVIAKSNDAKWPFPYIEKGDPVIYMSSHAGCTKKYGYTNLLEDTNLIGPSWAKATIEAELYIGKLKEKKADLKIDYRYEIISPTEGAVVVGNDKKTIKFRITKRNAAKKLTRQQTIVYSDEHYY